MGLKNITLTYNAYLNYEENIDHVGGYWTSAFCVGCNLRSIIEFQIGYCKGVHTFGIKGGTERE